eukprot:tig00000984_g5998.t1
MSQAAVRPINVKALVAKMRACKCVKGLGGEPEVGLIGRSLQLRLNAPRPSGNLRWVSAPRLSLSRAKE